MSLTYDPAAPWLQTTMLGGVTDSRTYDQLGKPASYTAKFGSSVLYSCAPDLNETPVNRAQVPDCS